MIRVVHVINDLDRGGAETVLYRLLAASSGRMDSAVISLTSNGVIGPKITELGIPVETLGVDSLLNYAAVVPRLRTRLASLQPQVVQTWMYHADLVGGLAARAARLPAVVWGLHATVRPSAASRLTYRTGLAAAARLSHHIPDRIVCCSEQSRRDHAAVGYAREKLTVITNGFEPLPVREGASRKVRDALRIPLESVVVAAVGRDHPDKDYATFLAAANHIHRRLRHATFLLVGHGLGPENVRLRRLIDDLRLGTVVHLLGPCERVGDVYAAADLVVCSSLMEALPLTLGEAMAMGVPVVTTAVGDARDLVGDPKRVVPARDPRALAESVLRVLEMDQASRAVLGQRDRNRVLVKYGLDGMVEAYLRLYRKVASGN